MTAGAGNRGPLTHDKLPIGNGWTRGRTCLARVLLLLLRLPPRSHPFEQFILRREFSDLAVQCLSEKFREEGEREGYYGDIFERASGYFGWVGGRMVEGECVYCTNYCMVDKVKYPVHGHVWSS